MSSFQDRVFFFLAYLSLCNMVSMTSGHTFSQSHFYRVQTTGMEEEFGLWPNFQSVVTCASLCQTYSDQSKPHCVGVQFDEHTKTCRLLSAYVNWTPSNSLVGKATYRKVPKGCSCAPAVYQEPCGKREFRLFNVSGKEICLGVPFYTGNYEFAKTVCLDRGAILPHLDTEVKFQAVEMDERIFSLYWVGLSNREGHWVYELNGQNISSYANSRWWPGEPYTSDYDAVDYRAEVTGNHFSDEASLIAAHKYMGGNRIICEFL